MLNIGVPSLFLSRLVAVMPASFCETHFFAALTLSHSDTAHIFCEARFFSALRLSRSDTPFFFG